MSFTPSEIARVAHEANRALQQISADPALSPHWDQAPEWQRSSALEGVEAVQRGATPEALHESWVRSKIEDGWIYGTVKDAEAKTHPCLVPYRDLPDDQKIKDDVFLAIVTTMSRISQGSPA